MHKDKKNGKGHNSTQEALVTVPKKWSEWSRESQNSNCLGKWANKV